MSDTVRAESVDWAAFYAVHGTLMRRAATSVLSAGVTKDGAVLGVSADDVIQQVMADLMENGLPPDLKSVEGFLYRRVESRATDARKRGVHQPDLPEDHDVPGHANVDLEVEARVESAAIFVALGQLPDRDQFILVERVLKKRTANEVADDLGIKPQGIPALVRAAVDRLRTNDEFMSVLDHLTQRSGTTS